MNDILKTPINVDLSKLKQINCKVCKGSEFIKACELKEIPAFVTGASQKALAELPVYICYNCGERLSDVANEKTGN